MLTRVSEDAIKFNRQLVGELMGNSGNNRKQLEIVRRVLHDTMEQDLTERQRQVLVMYYFEKKKTEEIAHALGVNKSTVSRTMMRARHRIQQNLRFYIDYMNVRLAE